MTTTPFHSDDDREDIPAEWPSPTNLTAPIWVLACVRLLPPEGRESTVDKVLTVAAALSAHSVKTSAADRVPLTREVIARMAGYGGKRPAKNAGWVVDYLTQIGLLERCKRYRSGTGHRADDLLSIRPEGRRDYVGPRSYSELYRALAEGGQWTWEQLFSPGGDLGNKAAGQALSPQVGTKADSPKSPGGDLGNKAAGQALSPQVGTLAFKGSFASEGREAKLPSSASVERDAASLRGPGDAALSDQVREIVRTAPWAAMGHTILEGEIDQLVPVIVAAISERGLSLASAQERLDQAIGRLTGRTPQGRIDFVVGAFTSHLAASVPSEQRPLPISKTPEKQPESSSRGRKSPSGARGGPQVDQEAQSGSQGRNRPEGGSEPEQDPVQPPAGPEAAQAVLAEYKRIRTERLRQEARAQRSAS